MHDISVEYARFMPINVSLYWILTRYDCVTTRHRFAVLCALAQNISYDNDYRVVVWAPLAQMTISQLAPIKRNDCWQKLANDAICLLYEAKFLPRSCSSMTYNRIKPCVSLCNLAKGYFYILYYSEKWLLSFHRMYLLTNTTNPFSTECLRSSFPAV